MPGTMLHLWMVAEISVVAETDGLGPLGDHADILTLKG